MNTPFLLKSALFTLICFIGISCKTEEPIVPIESVALDKTEISIAAGDSAMLTVNTLPAKSKATKLEWKSSNEKVAIVANGMVKALARGTAQIDVEVDDFYTTKCMVTVTQTDLPFKLVWSDEFDGTTLDLTKWNYETGAGGWGNNEKQHYTNRSENIRIENGNLIIEARKETYQSSSYTSARINTRDKVAFKYGKMEARISLPSGKGTWPAYWMMGANIGVARWPLCGEIDIMEHVGSNPTMISHATHTSEKNGSKGNNWHWQGNFENVENNFVTYAIEWEERANEGYDNISFYVNGVKNTTIWEPVNATVQQWPFKNEFFFLLNIAIGGNMGGTIDDSIFNNPVIMKVDYVRVYQRVI